MHRIILAVVAALLAVPAAASAHVTIQPPEQPAGGYTVINVRVPNESDSESTTKVVVQMPDGFESASYQAVPGWKIDVARDGERVSQITFSGGEIGPGQFQDFPLSVKMPEATAGTQLTFKALQTYGDGEVVRWIGAPDSEKPAPVVTLTAAEEAHGAAPHAAEETANQDAATGGGASDDEDGNGLAIVALIVGALGLLAGVAGLTAARRARTATA